MGKYRFILWIILIHLSIGSSSQTLSPRFKNYSPQEFDSHPQLLCIEPAKNGIMNFGTFQYILSYDGNTWRERYVKGGMGIASMVEDGDKDRFWLGGQGDFGYLTKDPDHTPKVGAMDTSTGFVSFLPLLPDSLQRMGMVWNTFKFHEEVFFNAFENLFLLTDQTIKVFTPESGSFFKAHKINGQLLIQDIGLKRYDKKKSELIPLPGSRSLKEKTIVAAFDWDQQTPSEEEMPDTLLLCTKRSGLFLYNTNTGKSQSFAPDHQPHFQTVGINTATSLPSEESIGRAKLVVGSITNGIYFFNREGKLVHSLNQEKGLKNNLIWDLHYSPDQGLLWVATNNGLTTVKTGTPITQAKEGKAFTGKVLGITRPHDASISNSSLFIATSQATYQLSSDTTPFPKTTFQPIEGTNSQCINILSYSPQRILVIQDQLLELTPNEQGAWESRPIDEQNAYSLAQHPTDKNLVALGGTDGIFFLRENNGKWKKVGYPIESDLGVNTMEFFQFPEADDPELWVGTSTDGIYTFQLPDSNTSGRSTIPDSSYTIHHYDTSKGLPKGPCRVFNFRGKPGIGTHNGMYKLASNKKHVEEHERNFEKNPLFTSLFPENHHRNVFFLQEENDSTFWIHFSFLSRVEKQGESWKVDSLSFKGFEIGGVRDIFPDPRHQHLTWIGTDNGLYCYDSRVKKRKTKDFPCLIRTVTGKKPPEKRKKGDVDTVLYKGKNLNEKGALTLPFSRNGLTFQYASPFFDQESHLYYRYLLKGFDQKWSSWSFSTEKEYTNLPEGTYTFQIQARNIYDQTSTIGQFQFTILPPWYRTWYAYIGYVLLSSGFIVLLLRLNSKRLRVQKEKLEKTVKARTQEIQQQKDRIEEVHKEISDSIEYAQRIQRALLQKEEHVTQHLPPHFILLKPQAIVSGDFYWAMEKDGHLYLAAIDCTGHGVPGAFMSMLGVSFLNEITSTETPLTPGEILTQLREKVVQELGGDAESGAADGMDAAMVRIELNGQDPEKTQVQFAGANNPMYLIRQEIGKELRDISFQYQSQSTELPDRIKPFKQNVDGIEIKGDKQGVGYELHSSESFTTVEINASKGDMVYLFSDGYPDQFGGPKGKKFRYGQFKKLLTRIHQWPLPDQKKELDRVIEEWKSMAGQEQIDDICVIGIEVV